MKHVFPWLSLVRWPNLLIVALTQWVAWWTIIAPSGGLVQVLTPAGFAMLCLSTVLIAAAGYIINDYFDIRIDVINKPDKVILERLIPRRAAIKVHWLFNGLALMLAAAVALPAGHPEWLLLQLFCIGLLWRYSTTWKRRFMIGNVIVALMTALTIVALIVYEPRLTDFSAGMIPGWHIPALPSGFLSLHNGFLALLLFSMFAFLLTWMREIVKDMEDFKGDEAEGCVTMPIRWGLLRSSRMVQALGGVTILLLLLAWLATVLVLTPFSSGGELPRDPGRFPGASYILAGYILLALIVPLAAWIVRLPRGATQRHYHKASRQLKWIMVLGIVMLLIIRFY